MMELDNETYAVDYNCSKAIFVDIHHQSSVIIQPTGNDTFLTVLTLTICTIGITLSAVALALLILTAVLFAEWRRNYKNQLLIQLMAARIIYTLIRYFYDITKAYDVYNRPNLDLHLLVFFYTEMALVLWMFVFSKQMYESLVKVFSVQTHSIVKVSLCTWGIPLLISIPLYVHIAAKKRAVRIYMIFLFVTKWPILVANAVLLILVLKSILKTNQSRTASNSRIVFVIIILIIVFCFQQFFIDIYKIIFLKVYSVTDEVTWYLGYSVVVFNLISLYHCAFSIFFWVFGNEKTRKLWRSRLKPKNQSTPISCIQTMK